MNPIPPNRLCIQHGVLTDLRSFTMRPSRRRSPAQTRNTFTPNRPKLGKMSVEEMHCNRWLACLHVAMPRSIRNASKVWYAHPVSPLKCMSDQTQTPRSKVCSPSHPYLTACFPFFFEVKSFISNANTPCFPCFPFLGGWIFVLQTGQHFLSPAWRAWWRHSEQKRWPVMF